LNAEDLESLCLFITVCNLLDHYGREWLEYSKPRKAIQYLKTREYYGGSLVAESIHPANRDFAILARTVLPSLPRITGNCWQ